MQRRPAGGNCNACVLNRITAMTLPRAAINLTAIADNYRYAKSLAPGKRALAVVKADAYGHGAIAVSRALADRVDGFAVARLDEALQLRDAGITQPLLLLEGVFSEEEYRLADAAHCWTVVHNAAQLAWLHSVPLSTPTHVWLKLNTGMNRLGLTPAQLRQATQHLAGHHNVTALTLMTHFACADDLHSDVTHRQLDRFRQAVADLKADHSLANSAAILAWPAAHGDWLRPGILLYGASPLLASDAPQHALNTTMTLTTELIAVRELAAGACIGYGARWRADHPVRMGVAAIGYADGYPRSAPDGTPVLVNGQRSRIIGRVSMDMITVDLTDIPNAGIGADVQLWGPELPVNEVATACGTIAYELFTRLTSRVRRIYHPESA